ncbi:MAG: dihydropteroate synthase-like protein [Desulfurococcaceae archaeon]
MKLLLVTGRLAYKHVVEVAEKTRRELGVEVDVLELPIPVAAMINVNYLLRELPRHRSRLSGVDIIIVPGYADGDMSSVSSSFGIPVIKGPRYVYDLPLMVKALLEGVKFSPVIPADEVLREYTEKREQEILNKVKARAQGTGVFTIGSLRVTSDYPLVILEAYAKSPDDLERYKEAFKHADAVSLGFPYGFDVEESVRIVKHARELLAKPIGVDSVDFNLVIKVAEIVDFINGVPVESAERLVDYRSLIREKPLVLTATTGSPRDRIDLLKKRIAHLEERGFEKLIVDPLLMPPLQGLVESLEAYALAKREMPNTPVLMGTGNVTELVDVDSIGLNALLAFIGVELGIELYLTTEESAKTRGSVKELRKALDMAVLARELKRPPKDLSTNMLVAKSKRRAVTPLPRAEVIVNAVERLPLRHDPRGYFKIAVNHEKGEILLQHYEPGALKPSLEIRGRDPYAIFAEVIRRNLVSLHEHCFYLGYELAKASISLKVGREYEQDKEMF